MVTPAPALPVVQREPQLPFGGITANAKNPTLSNPVLNWSKTLIEDLKGDLSGKTGMACSVNVNRSMLAVNVC